MLLTINCKDQDAMDLSWLLHKRPDRFQKFDLGYGNAFIFFPEYARDNCTACLLLEIRPDSLNDLCKARDGEFQYVNSRQYLSSSLLSAAIGKTFSSALKGVCQDTPALVDKHHDIEIRISNFSCRINPDFIERILTPLGYGIEWEILPNDGYYSDGGFSYGDLRLRIHATVQDTLSHLYILFPVFDRQTHFWLGESHLQKFIRHSQKWLGGHPEKRLIINEYFGPAADLKHRVLELFGALRTQDDNPQFASLNHARQSAIEGILAASGAKTVIDLGCGNGSLLSLLHEKNSYEKLAGMDVSAKSIESARKKFEPPFLHARVAPEIFIGSLTYSDKRISGYDAAILSEVIEHFETERMDSVMRNILGEARPRLFVMTTPNKAYNQEFPFLEHGALRHPDHRHEFDESEFSGFCEKYAHMFDYNLEMAHIGEELSDVGAPTLLGIFKKCS